MQHVALSEFTLVCCRLEGEALLRACRDPNGRGLSAIAFASGFVRLLDLMLGVEGWEAVAGPVLEAHPGGPPDTALVHTPLS